MVEKTKKTINFRFNLIIHDLKNLYKTISELKQKEYNFKIIRHKNKKYAFIKRLFGGFKKTRALEGHLYYLQVYTHQNMFNVQNY